MHKRTLQIKKQRDRNRYPIVYKRPKLSKVFETLKNRNYFTFFVFGIQIVSTFLHTLALTECLFLKLSKYVITYNCLLLYKNSNTFLCQDLLNYYFLAKWPSWQCVQSISQCSTQLGQMFFQFIFTSYPKPYEKYKNMSREIVVM